MDAAFGGLICEEAVCAALDSKSLQVLRGRTPPRSMTRRVRSSTAQILSEWRSRREVASAGPYRQSSCRGSTDGTKPSARGGSNGRSVLLRYLRFGAFVGALVGLLGGASYGAWALLHEAEHAHVSLTPTGRDPDEAAACGQSIRELGVRTIQTASGARRGSCSLVTQALVDSSGSVSGVRVRSASDCSASLENAAIQSLLGAKFEPAQCRGRFVASWAEIPIRFEDSSATAAAREAKLAQR